MAFDQSAEAWNVRYFLLDLKLERNDFAAPLIFSYYLLYIFSVFLVFVIYTVLEYFFFTTNGQGTKYGNLDVFNLQVDVAKKN